MRVHEWVKAAGLAAILAVPCLAQEQSGILRISVRVPETLAPVPGVQISVTPSNSELLDLPDNEQDLLAYLTRLAEARGIAAGNLQVITTGFNGQAMSPGPGRCPNPTSFLVKIDSPAAVTDADGNAVIRNLSAGTYDLRAGRDGYLEVLPPESGAGLAPSIVWSSVVIGGGTSESRISLFLNPETTVSGHILDANGAPAVNVCVLLERVKQLTSGTNISPGARAITDDKGENHLRSVSPGEYVLRAQSTQSPEAVGYYPGAANAENARTLSIEAGREIVGIDFKLP